LDVFPDACVVLSLLGYRELFDYIKAERARLIESFGKMSNEDFAKDRGLSFGSMKDVLVHIVMVEDNWLHYRAAGLGTGTSLKPEDFKNLNDIKKYIADVDAKTAKMFDKMTDRDLQKQVKRTYPDGREDVYTLEQLLYHIPLEIIHHIGEIFAGFWSMNIDAPYYSYLSFSKEKAKT
jgi:uncharacterized damage-inducible protein DinB